MARLQLPPQEVTIQQMLAMKRQQIAQLTTLILDKCDKNLLDMSTQDVVTTTIKACELAQVILGVMGDYLEKVKLEKMPKQ